MIRSLEWKTCRILSGAVVVLVMVTPLLALAVSEPDFKPGYNFYSPQQDVQLGMETSAQVAKQLPLLNDPVAQDYLNGLGKKLVAFAPNNQPEYAWQFRIVNSPEINAFALPGGYIYVNRGVFDAVEDEGQLAGVIAHEAGHVVMRHGTHAASEAILAQGGMAIVSNLLGRGGSLAGQLAQLGLGLGVDSLLLKNSRTAETQADEVGTYILYQAGYDPHAMVQFFQIIARRYPQRTAQFFSDHPNPENRIENVDLEIGKLGPARTVAPASAQFSAAKHEFASLPPAPQTNKPPATDSKASAPVQPSANFAHFDGGVFTLDYPDNWEVQRGEDGVLIFPPGGIVVGSEGESAQAYGLSIGFYTPQEESWGLIDATQELVASMQQANPQIHVLQQTGLSLQRNPALSTLLQSESPIEGQRETDHLVTVRRGESVLAFTFIAPMSAFESYAPTFDRIIQSIDLARK